MEPKLISTPQGLGLKITDDNSTPWVLEYDKGTIGYRLSNFNFQAQLIKKALGKLPKQTTTIFDATCGLGIDAIIFAKLGYQVTTFERNFYVYSIVNDAMQRAKNDPKLKSTFEKIELINSCLIKYFDNPLPKPYPDVVYCDPMFESAAKKSALSKKSMQILQTVVGDDKDAHLLVNTAIRFAKQRVVVKRPKSGQCIINNPTFCVHGKSHRFDIYVV